MNKTDLIVAVANATGKSKREIASLIDTTFDIIIDTMASGDEVQICGFGTIYTRIRTERDGRNPKTGEAVHIAASVTPCLRGGSRLMKAINSKSDKN